MYRTIIIAIILVSVAVPAQSYRLSEKFYESFQQCDDENCVSLKGTALLECREECKKFKNLCEIKCEQWGLQGQALSSCREACRQPE